MAVTKSRLAGAAACVVTVAALGVTASAWRQAVPPPAPADYDSFCKRTPEEKRLVFGAISAENRTELVRIQVERWRDANQTRLTPPQMSSLKEMLDLVTPELYRLETPNEALIARMRAVEQKQVSLFTREDLTDMGLNGPCLAKKSE